MAEWPVWLASSEQGEGSGRRGQTGEAGSGQIAKDLVGLGEDGESYCKWDGKQG